MCVNVYIYNLSSVARYNLLAQGPIRDQASPKGQLNFKNIS